jgi:hypothetical protein
MAMFKKSNDQFILSAKSNDHVQKLLYGVLITVRKLSHYFQGHSVTVVTSFPLGDILHNREANGWYISNQGIINCWYI